VAELANYEECFVSSSIREILPVVRIDGEVVGTGKPGPLSRKLLEQYRARVRRAARGA
jgi:branched-subunit amino acid aminotransferase/4-amino-4-deoxychorismate lyase